MTRFNSQKKSRLLSVLFLLALVFCIGCGLFLKGSSEPLAEQQHIEWKDYGGGPDHS